MSNVRLTQAGDLIQIEIGCHCKKCAAMVYEIIKIQFEDSHQIHLEFDAVNEEVKS